MTAKEAMQHPYFDCIRKAEAEHNSYAFVPPPPTDSQAATISPNSSTNSPVSPAQTISVNYTASPGGYLS